MTLALALSHTSQLVQSGPTQAPPTPLAVSAVLTVFNDTPPALHDILKQFGPPNPKARPPYIAPGSPHYKFAALVLVGYEYPDACDALDLNPRTVARWRSDLCRDATKFFGRRVSYEFAARYVLDKDFRKICKVSATSIA